MKYGREKRRNKSEILETTSGGDQNLQNFSSKVFLYLQYVSFKENYMVKIDCLSIFRHEAIFFPIYEWLVDRINFVNNVYF